MRDRIWVIAALALFVAAMTAPFWYRQVPTGKLTKLPDIVLPVDQQQCVGPTSYMRSSHMVLLTTWRQEVVRSGDRRYTGLNSKIYVKSMTGTCLGCHNKAQFCDRCHTYAGISGPYCWDCHNPGSSRAVAAAEQGMPARAGKAELTQSLQAHLLPQIGDVQPSRSFGSRP